MSANGFGGCPGCHTHSSNMGSAAKAYSYLSQNGYISGTSSALVKNGQSCLSWYQGNMPPGVGGNAQAVKDMNAWAAAGALNN